MKVTGCVLGQYFAWSKVKQRKRQRNNIGEDDGESKRESKATTNEVRQVDRDVTPRGFFQRLYVFLSESFFLC